MIPTLYQENTTQFTANGLGRLTDAISCSVKQNKTGTYELTMEYPLNGIHAELITNNRIIYAKPERGKNEQPFRIRNIEKNLKGRMKITARHNCYDLNYYACGQFGQTEVLPYKVTPSVYSSSKQFIGVLSTAETHTVSVSSDTWTMLLQYPSNAVYSSNLVTGNYIYAQPEIGRELVFFQITTVQEIVIGTKTVTATASIVPYVPQTQNQMTVAQAVNSIGTKTNQIQFCPFTFSVDPTTAGDTWVSSQHEFWSDIPKAVRTLMQGSEGSIVDIFGGEWEFDHYACILHEQRGSDNGVQYRYGKNIISISERINIDEIYTHAFSFWKGTASSSTDTEQGEYYVKSGTVVSILDSAYTAMFPLQRTLIIDASSEFETEPSQNSLDAYTQKYASDHQSGIPQVTIEVSIVDLANTKEYEDIAQLEQVNLYDTVTVVFPKFGVNVKSKITEVEYDVLKEKNNRVIIGDVTTNLSNIIANNKRDIVRAKYELRRWADRAMERATEALAGWAGGNIRKNYNKNDHKQQSMYIMNTDDIETAERAMTFDGAGFAISKNGARGDYKYMVDMSGNRIAFSDAFADDGDTNASFLKRGIIGDNTNHWDMETGEAYFDLVKLDVQGATNLRNNLSIAGSTTANVLNVTGDTNANNLNVSGDSEFEDSLVNGTLLLGENQIDVEQALDSLGTSISDAESDISNAESRIGSLESRMNNAESRIGNVEGSVSSLSSTVGSLGSIVDSLEDRVSALEQRT